MSTDYTALVVANNTVLLEFPANLIKSIIKLDELDSISDDVAEKICKDYTTNKAFRYLGQLKEKPDAEQREDDDGFYSSDVEYLKTLKFDKSGEYSMYYAYNEWFRGKLYNSQSFSNLYTVLHKNYDREVEKLALIRDKMNTLEYFALDCNKKSNVVQEIEMFEESKTELEYALYAASFFQSLCDSLDAIIYVYDDWSTANDQSDEI